MIKGRAGSIVRQPLVLLMSATLLFTVPERAFSDRGFMVIPLKWCAVQGSQAVENPAGVGEPTTKDVLWRRHERATDFIYNSPENRVGIGWRSAAIAAIPMFPEIDDPFSPGTLLPSPPFAMGRTAPGMLGDIITFVPDSDIAPPVTDERRGEARTLELKLARNACSMAWDKHSTLAGSGVFAHNIRRFIDMTGAPDPMGRIGLGGPVIPQGGILGCDRSGQLGPKNVTVIDNQFLRLEERKIDQLLAHELGHALTLEHGDGIDSDNDGNLDEMDEDDNAKDPSNLMTTALSCCPETQTKLTRDLVDLDQVEKILTCVPEIAGVMTDPPGGGFTPGPTITDLLVDAVQDAPEPFTDIDSVSITQNQEATTTTFAHQVFGRLRRDVAVDAFILADLDNNSTTGGSPAVLGIPTTFTGAELVTQVRATISGDPEFPSVVAIPTVWRFLAGSFVIVTDPSIQARVSTPRFEGGPSVSDPPSADVISIIFNDAVRGPTDLPFRIEAITQNLSTGIIDRLAKEVLWTIPSFPECGVDPETAEPGDFVTVEAKGLPANETAKIFLGDQMVATGVIDSAGKTSILFRIPEGERRGDRLIQSCPICRLLI
jgi:hypothetical protein